MKILNSTFLLRFAVSVILLVHSLAGMFTGDITAFGNSYLNKVGFVPFGLYLAWAIKLSHIAMAISLFTEKYVKLFGWITICILTMGIIMIHGKEGWFVVGGGTNGVEFNFLLIFSLLTIMYWKQFQKE